MIKTVLRMFAVAHAVVAVLFGGAALLLLMLATMILIRAASELMQDSPDVAANTGIEAVGLIAVGVLALQMAQTIVEEEVVREAHVSAPTRVRRFLSRFMVIVVIALAIEALVATFKALHTDPTHLPHAAAIAVGAASLLLGWGVFIHLNRGAEELEPEAMQRAKREDVKIDGAG